MNKKKSTYYLTVAAVIAAMYAGLTVAQNLILPGSASASVQVRLSEALCALCVITPAAVPGVTVGCVIANLTSAGTMPLDIVFGSAATLISGILMYKFRNIRVKSLPLLSLFMPVVFNAVIVGLELTFFMPSESGVTFKAFLLQALLIAAGELISVFALGIPLEKAVEKHGIIKSLD
ncbi:MAG: QueT transporter family protein [Acutalibacteraceae bacterium]|nr:QueT transporter family protein [Oscillospiraceae bacterium]